MVSFRKGITHKPAASERLLSFFKNNDTLEGLLYIGYPILFTAGESTTIDAIWISDSYGIVIFDLVEGNTTSRRSDHQDKLFGLLQAQLVGYPVLKKGRELAVQIEVISYAPACPLKEEDYLIAFSDTQLKKIIANLKPNQYKEHTQSVVSILQSVINLKSRNKRDNIHNPLSKGSKIKALEDTIATLDNDQEEAIIEFVDGLQRIRGLAGSGKTIVLALKAALLHVQHPEWNIAVTFNTRALKDQFKDLISRFSAEKRGALPDFTKIRIINAWGSPRDVEDERGLYYDFCFEHSLEYYDFKKAESLAIVNGKKSSQAFEMVIDKALNNASRYVEKYDAILVDEAQDLSESFLKMCYAFLKKPKRLIYAYDELQKLNEGSPLRSPKLIFGEDAQDTILKKCYRNSRPLLVTAHSLGFGIYRNEGLVQFFDQPQLWGDLGYYIKQGSLAYNSKVLLARNNESSPEYLEKHSDINDLIVFKEFSDFSSQASWIASEIEKNLQKEELLHKDIIVINPIALTTEKRVSEIRSLLASKNIDSHIAGKFDPDTFFKSKSITFTGINRAKGNEVPMVYIINADDCYSDSEFENLDLIKRRNILFTAITRSKAWVRICGVGIKMKKLTSEYERVKAKNYELDFTYPTEKDIARMNLIHRDISESEKVVIKQEEDSLKNVAIIIGKIRKGEGSIYDYSPEVQVVLKQLLGE